MSTDIDEIVNLAGDVVRTIDPLDPAPEGWQGITDDKLAAWALDKLAHYTAERDRLRQNHADYIALLADKLRADLAPLDDKVQFFEGQLVAYYRSLPDPPKTYKLPNGTIAARAGRASTKVVETAAFVSWAIHNAPEALKHEPLVSALKDWPRDDDGNVIDPESGERVPGVETVVGETSYTVKAEGGQS